MSGRVPPTEVSRLAGLDAASVVCAFDHGTGGVQNRKQAEGLARGVTVIVCTYKRAASLGRFLDSLAPQSLKPDALVVVDASPDDQTDSVLRSRTDLDRLARRTSYFRVDGPLRGLTRQRNFGLRKVFTDLVAFFDDDIALEGNCLAELERQHRLHGKLVVGVGALISNQMSKPNALWRFRCWSRSVSSLRPGSYHDSGMSVPWGFLNPVESVVEGDWLPGGCTMWKTGEAADLGFDEMLTGYGQGEDLDFSLRLKGRGRLVVAPAARVQHLHEPSGRPDAFQLGYMAILNRYRIHRRAFPGPQFGKLLWFAYAWSVDTVLLLRHLIAPSRYVPTVREIAGRILAAYEIAVHRRI